MSIRSAHFLPGKDKQLGDRYLLLECLGDGSHGWVWRAQRLRDDAIVAVKIPKNLSSPDRSLAEGKELLGIPGHPNVVQIFDMGRVPPEKEWYVIEMEYFPSESLAQKLERRSHNFGNTYSRLFNIYTQVLDAVIFLGTLEKPISHGDIKPHNILIGQDDHVKLTDFGSSALPEEIYVRTRENGGTVLYAAPEFSDCASRKGSVEELLAGDIYSLGVLLYQLTTGTLPHDTQAQVLRHDPFQKPREINSGICKQLEDVILKCLAKDPAARFSSVTLLKEKFLKATDLQSQQANVVHLEPTTSRSRDWSTDVIDALENSDYLKAASIANAEYQRSSDLNALMQQLHALYRAERWFDFEKVLESAALDAISSRETPGRHIRTLAVKAYMQLRKLEDAQRVLAIARKAGDDSFDLDMCEASIDAMQARYADAREKLEKLNKKTPGNLSIVRRLVLVCEQCRDYESGAGYLRFALKLAGEDEKLIRKRQQYESLGIW